MNRPAAAACGWSSNSKKAPTPAVVENQLYQLTPLQSTFSIMNIVLVRGQPRTVGLKELIQHYIEHRADVVRRRTAFRLRKAQQEAHRIEGLIYAVCDLDEVIRLIRASRTRDEAIEKLLARGFRIRPDHPYAPRIPQRFLNQSAANDARLSRVQAEAIGPAATDSIGRAGNRQAVEEYASCWGRSRNTRRSWPANSA